VAFAIDQLTRLGATTDGRLDTLEEERVHTDARLDALIDSQIALGQRFDQMTARFNEMGARVDQVVARVDQVVARFDQMATRVDAHEQHLARIDESLTQSAALSRENAEAIKALIAAQARTDERINDLLDRNGQKP
jgi:DNA repair ATPase RecN